MILPEAQTSRRAGLLAPVLLLVILAAAVIGTLIHVSANEVNALARSGGERLARSMLRSAESHLARPTNDYARWDEAYANLAVRFDANWAEVMLGADLHAMLAIDRTLVFGGDGKALFSRGGSPPPSLRAAHGTIRALASIAAVRHEFDQVAAGPAIIDGELYMAAVAVVRPQRAVAEAEGGGGPVYLVLGRRMDQRWLDAAAEDFMLTHLHLGEQPEAGDASLAVKAANGEVLGWLAWEPDRPGGLVLRRMGAPLAFVMLAGIMLVLVIIERGHRIASALEQANTSLRDANDRLERAVLERTRELRQEVEERRQAQQNLLHEATHDALTGLPNRTLLMDRLQGALARAKRRPERKVALMFLDCDRFKLINDTMGHPVGDELLIQLSQRLKGAVRVVDTVARLGGDEFAVLLDGVAGEAEAVIAAQRIQAAMAEPFLLAERPVPVRASIGIALSSIGGSDPNALLRDADIAMYRAKSGGSGRMALFESAMLEENFAKMEIEAELRAALAADDQLFVVYQPIVSLAEGGERLTGFEALARWRHPRLGMVPPDRFIPVAEETGLIVTLGERVLQAACREFATWRRSSPEHSGLVLSVNLSLDQLESTDSITRLWAIIEESGLEPRALKLEVTETAMMRQERAILDGLAALREFGVRLVIDDFGTGYSSLGQLHRLPFDGIKLDRSFVARLGEGRQHVEIIRTVVAMAQTLQFEMVAEGIETEEEARLLQNLGCPLGQGYLFGRPMDGARVAELLRQTAAVGV